MSGQNMGMLVLEDGSAFSGPSMGAEGTWVGEVVFNTSMAGYQEIITDASYWGQMVAFTCPHIGNVGVNTDDVESRQPYATAVLARQICERPSNWRSQQPLPAYLREHNIPALSGLDIRRLTLLLREKGVMRAALAAPCAADASPERERLWAMARQAPDMSSLAPAEHVTPPTAQGWAIRVPAAWRPSFEGGYRGRRPTSTSQPDDPQPAPRIVLIDCGVKYNIARHLASLGAHVTMVPAQATAEQILGLHPAGVLVSNGPGDPVNWSATVATVRALIGQAPLLGICLGHQLIGLASGALTFKLPFGHHGGNHPVQDLRSGAIAITAQNHNFAVVEESLAGLPLEVTHRNLNDRTIEGLRHTAWPVSCVQYHPEASPGPHDSLYILRQFVHSLNPKS